MYSHMVNIIMELMHYLVLKLAKLIINFVNVFSPIRLIR